MPPCTPKGLLSSVSPFYVVFLGSGACLPPRGRCRRWRDGRGFFPKDSLPLTPSHARTLQKEGGALAREGETILYISFQRGRWSPVATVHRRPRRQPRPAPLEPQGHGCPRFLFCTPKRPDLSPPMGAQVPSGHRSAPTEPAGETVPPMAAEGVCLEVL